jgi:enamine deaminase RidA (YjgF/YER057c/UK114 family)
MSGRIAARLKELGIVLPIPPAPVASYVPTVFSGRRCYVSGQVCMVDGKIAVAGHLGAGVTLDQGREAARICGVNILAQLALALGDLDRVVQVVKLTGFVASTPDFTDQPKVINGCSDLLVEVFGEAGRHARSAVGVAALPLNAAVEVEAIVEVAAR